MLDSNAGVEIGKFSHLRYSIFQKKPWVQKELCHMEKMETDRQKKLYQPTQKSHTTKLSI
jgi:hypothetical protein